MQKGFAPILIVITLAVISVTGLTTAWYTKTIQIPNFPPPGCSYQEVQCIKAPCNPVLVCTTPSSTPIMIEETDNWKTYTSEKLGDVSFNPFSIKYPSQWILSIERTDPDFFKLELTKEGYKLEIFQAGMGGAVCLFKGDKDFEGSNADYKSKNYVEIETNIGLLRRVELTSNSPDSIRFSICNKLNSEYFEKPTQIGSISYEVPKNYDLKLIEEMDKIIKTLQEK